MTIPTASWPGNRQGAALGLRLEDVRQSDRLRLRRRPELRRAAGARDGGSLQAAGHRRRASHPRPQPFFGGT